MPGIVAIIPLNVKATNLDKYTFFPREAVKISSSLRLCSVYPNELLVIREINMYIMNVKNKDNNKKEILLSKSYPPIFNIGILAIPKGPFVICTQLFINENTTT